MNGRSIRPLQAVPERPAADAGGGFRRESREIPDESELKPDIVNIRRFRRLLNQSKCG
ncbi:MAG: hypothetical protein RLZZ08_1156 [Pseudomonadota bacterium]|jgi:hypothetical protein